MGRGTIEIKTDRLLLRRYVEEDAVTLNRNFGLDPEMVKYSGWNPYATGEKARRTVKDFMSRYEDEHFYGWAIEHDSRLVGTIGAYDYDPAEQSVEIGFSIERASWGQGFAGEALKAVTTYLMGSEKIRRITSWSADRNIGSIKVLERAGFKRVSIEPEALEIDGMMYDKINYELQG